MQENCIEPVMNVYERNKKLDDSNYNMNTTGIGLSIWMCCAVLAWLGANCLRKRSREESQQPAPRPQLQVQPHRAPEGPPVAKPAHFSSSSSSSSTLRLGKPVQPISSISLLRVSNKYIEGLDIKGVVGMGASGRSYLASFFGAPVAVKIIEHNVRGANRSILGAMKVLSVPCPHPNILHTYRIAVVELPSASRTLLLPSRVRRVEQPREVDPALVAAAEPDLLDDCYDSEDSWEPEDEDYTNEKTNDYNYVTESENGSPVTRVGATAAAPGGNLQAGKIIHLWDLLPHPCLTPDQLYLIDRDVGPSGRNSVLRPSYSAPHASTSCSAAAAGSTGSGSSTTSRPSGSSSNNVDPLEPSKRPESRSMPLPGCFPASGLSKALRPGMYEIWVVTEFADKGSFEDYVVKKQLVRHPEGAPNLDIILRLLLDVAQGMAELHRRGIIHADLKPSNIMLVGSSTDPRGWVAKVSDAALLPLLDLTLTHTSIKHHSRMQCLPPELVLQDVTSPPLDVYCFAMLMWKSWTCERPFKGMDMKTFFNDVIERGKRPPVDGHCTAGMPPAYKELMQACWAADPAARPSFEFICEKLRELFSSLGPQQ